MNNYYTKEIDKQRGRSNIHRVLNHQAVKVFPFFFSFFKLSLIFLPWWPWENDLIWKKKIEIVPCEINSKSLRYTYLLSIKNKLFEDHI